MSCHESNFFQNVSSSAVSLLLEGNVTVIGRFTFISSYSVGFVPAEDYTQLGFQKNQESLIMKSFIRAVTEIVKLKGIEDGQRNSNRSRRAS